MHEMHQDLCCCSWLIDIFQNVNSFLFFSILPTKQAFKMQKFWKWMNLISLWSGFWRLHKSSLHYNIYVFIWRLQCLAFYTVVVLNPEDELCRCNKCHWYMNAKRFTAEQERAACADLAAGSGCRRGRGPEWSGTQTRRRPGPRWCRAEWWLPAGCTRLAWLCDARAAQTVNKHKHSASVYTVELCGSPTYVTIRCLLYRIAECRECRLTRTSLLWQRPNMRLTVTTNMIMLKTNTRPNTPNEVTIFTVGLTM